MHRTRMRTCTADLLHPAPLPPPTFAADAAARVYGRPASPRLWRAAFHGWPSPPRLPPYDAAARCDSSLCLPDPHASALSLRRTTTCCGAGLRALCCTVLCCHASAAAPHPTTSMPAPPPPRSHSCLSAGMMPPHFMGGPPRPGFPPPHMGGHPGMMGGPPGGMMPPRPGALGAGCCRGAVLPLDVLLSA